MVLNDMVMMRRFVKIGNRVSLRYYKVLEPHNQKGKISVPLTTSLTNLFKTLKFSLNKKNWSFGSGILDLKYYGRNSNLLNTIVKIRRRIF